MGHALRSSDSSHRLLHLADRKIRRELLSDHELGNDPAFSLKLRRADEGFGPPLAR